MHGRAGIDAAERYFSKMNRITLAFSVGWNLLVYLATPALLGFYDLSPETVGLTISLVALHNVFNALVFPFSGCLGNGLRATGDVAFTMWVSILSTLLVRLTLSYLLGVVFGMGVMGIAWAMCADWLVRAVFLVARLRSGAWKEKRVV